MLGQSGQMRLRPPVPASSLVTVVASVLLLTGCSGVPGEDGPPRADRAGAVPAGAAPTGEPAAPVAFPASDVLRAWDGARGRAFADGDVRALRRLYVDGSTAGMSDVRLLRYYLDRGFTVGGMRMQVLTIEVLHEDARRLRLLVTDRLTGAVAVRNASRIRLPRDQASTRVVELRRQTVRSPWRVAVVRESSQRPGARSASAARTRTRPRAAWRARPGRS